MTPEEKTATEGKDHEPRKPHLSPSAINSFSMCGEAYRQMYVEKKRIPPGLAAHKGRGIHAGAEANWKHKMLVGSDLSADQIVDASVQAFHLEIKKDGVMLLPDEVAAGQSVVIGKMVDRVARVARVFAMDVAPPLIPAAVEEWIRVGMNGSDYDVLGRIDMRTVEDVIWDLKTSGKAPNKTAADESLQMTFYALAFEVEHGRPVGGLEIQTIRDTGKTEPVALQPQKTTRSAADIQAFVNRINIMLRALKTGVFPPAAVGSWNCSPKWCAFWHECPYVNSERAAAAAEAGE